MSKPPEVSGSVESGVVFTFTESEPDGGGSLSITAYTTDFKKDLCRCYRRALPEWERYAPCAVPDPLTITLSPRDLVNYGREAWYAFPLALDDEWFIPYKRALYNITGYDSEISDFSIPDPRSICATHHRSDYRIESGHICATIYVSSHPWNKQTALDYGHAKAERYFKEDIGYVPDVPEFIESRNGQYHRNPKYGTGYRPPVQPRVQCEYLWHALFSWWRTTHATPRQRELLDLHDALHVRADLSPDWHAKYGHGPRMYQGFHYADPNGGSNWSPSDPATWITLLDFQKA